MRIARACPATLCFAVFVCLVGSGSSPLAAEHRLSAAPADVAHGSGHFKGKSRVSPPDRPVGRSFTRLSSQSLWSGGRNPTVIGGPYRPNRNVVVWGQPLKAMRSAAAVSGTAKNRGRY